MPTILVLHGPNMALKGADDIDEALEIRATALGVELSIVQSNSEASLVDELTEQRHDVEGVLVNPGVAAPAMVVLAEALALVGRPAVEVLLAPLASGTSALAPVVKGQIHDKGKDGYAAGLELLAQLLGVQPPPPVSLADESDAEVTVRAARPVGTRVAKTIGRKGGPEEAAATLPAKTVGRRPVEGMPVHPQATQLMGLSRDVVRAKVAQRLSGTLSADELASWARGEWASLQKGGPHEPGSKELLENVLLTLMSSARASEHLLLAQMAKLEG